MIVYYRVSAGELVTRAAVFSVRCLRFVLFLRAVLELGPSGSVGLYTYVGLEVSAACLLAHPDVNWHVTPCNTV